MKLKSVWVRTLPACGLPTSAHERSTHAGSVRTQVFCVCLAIILATAVNIACRRAGREITVSAAASLMDAFREIGKQYEGRTGVKVNFNFGSSGALQKQIESGAPVDVFASAGIPQMDALASQGLIAPETRKDFTRNTLVLIVPAGSGSGIASFADLGGAKLNRLAVGNPKTVPVGQYAEQSLTHLGLWQKLGSRLVLAEDVRQTLDYVARGEVDAGIVYSSDVRAAGDRVRVVATAPANSHEPIRYPIAVMRGSSQQEAARSFIDAVTSPEGERILEKYGFEEEYEKNEK